MDQLYSIAILAEEVKVGHECPKFGQGLKWKRHKKRQIYTKIKDKHIILPVDLFQVDIPKTSHY